MPSERVQRQIDRLLDETEAAVGAGDWGRVRELAADVLALDADNADAGPFLSMAERRIAMDGAAPAAAAASADPVELRVNAAPPESFVGGRYHVRRFLGEGGKKKVYLAHDETLDRDVAFALIKTEGLDATGRERIVREAQAMGRMGTHPHVVSIFEIGEESGAPYVVTELMGGGDVEGLLRKATGSEPPPAAGAASSPVKGEGAGLLPLERSLQIAKDVCDGLVFAHAQGIVHRDLKSGNVWLTADGVAKIGDFGLAVNLGRSRLTQHGLMVGTVAYMPPEQALGGEPTPQSDLYSLGAMLYELVTGKPPFQADDPTAVISQHINTPPVAPSWNSDRCPPDLERLILQLLAKSPADRPASATEVREALARIDPDAKSASHSDSQVNPLDRLARGVFVGRERELERLRGAFDQAFAGRGSVVMLVGEPGIGKTRTVQEVETYARMRGAQVYWGRANESGGAPPFWPWLLAGRAYRDQNADEVRRKEWGPYATELQRIFPALRDLFPNLPPPPAVDSEEGQFQLFDAMSSFVRGVSERVPLVVALDDLHWADRGTLQLLAHLARDLGHARILVLGTYRDTDLDRRHPLSQALAEMNREALFLRVPLRGLDEREVRHYIARAAGLEPSRELARRVFEETEGNPFFLSEVVNLMTQEGTLGAASVSDVAIPEGVRQALGRRLDRLSAEANSLLTTLAVAGREFDHALVRSLSGHDERITLQLIEEALAARVLEETGRTGEYRFTHALMQETLLSELSAARRVLLHGQIAEAFETLYGPDDRDHLVALANHYAESAVLNREHARNAVRYLRLAAEQSMAALGYDDAAKLFERCLGVIEQSHDAYGEDAAALWAALALSRHAIGELVAGRAALERALALFAERGDARGPARAVADFWEGASAQIFRREQPVLDVLIAALGNEDSVELCRLLAMRGVAELSPDGDAVAARAEAMALRLGLTGVASPFQLALRAWYRLCGQGAFREAAALMDAREVEPGSIGAFLRTMLGSGALAYVGDIDGQLAKSSEFVAMARTYRRRGLEARGIADIATVAWRRGERAEAEMLLAGVDVNTHPQAVLVPPSIALADGEIATALRLLPPPDHPAMTGGTSHHVTALRIRMLWLAGDSKPARGALDPLLAEWDYGNSGEQFSLLGCGDVAIALAQDPYARAVGAYLEGAPALRCYPGPVGGLGNPDVLRGTLALRFGDLDAAEQHFRTGLEWASKPDVRFVVDQGRCLQGLAEVAERRGDLETAREHLDAAGALFAAHGGARLYLDQVLAKKQFLKA